MINNVGATPSFGSTRLPIDSTDVFKYLKPLNQYFEVKGFAGNKAAQEYADQIDFGKAAFVMGDKEAMVIGKDDSADKFIFRLLKKINPEAKYVDDIKPIKTDTPIIDLEV